MRLTMMVSLPPQLSSIGEARHLLDGLLSLTAAEEEARENMAVLVTEACANVVQHGDLGATIDLSVAVEDGLCVLEVGNLGRVPGGGVLPTRFPEPAQTNGRGLPLIGASSDSAEFVATTPGYVLLRMTLRLHARFDMRELDLPGP